MAATVPPSDTRRIYLARHGETSLNAAGLLRGRLDPDLTERGERQAEALANALDGLWIDAVVASPLRRAVNTAMAVARRIGLMVATDDDFVDRDYGEWAGSSLDEVSARWGSIDLAPGVESRSSVIERAMRGLQRVAHLEGHGAALIVSHDAVNRLVLSQLDSHLPEPLAQATGCYNVLSSSEDGWTVESVNNVPRIQDSPA